MMNISSAQEVMLIKLPSRNSFITVFISLDISQLEGSEGFIQQWMTHFLAEVSDRITLSREKKIPQIVQFLKSMYSENQAHLKFWRYLNHENSGDSIFKQLVFIFTISDNIRTWNIFNINRNTL